MSLSSLQIDKNKIHFNSTCQTLNLTNRKKSLSSILSLSRNDASQSNQIKQTKTTELNQILVNQNMDVKDTTTCNNSIIIDDSKPKYLTLNNPYDDYMFIKKSPNKIIEARRYQRITSGKHRTYKSPINSKIRKDLFISKISDTSESYEFYSILKKQKEDLLASKMTSSIQLKTEVDTNDNQDRNKFFSRDKSKILSKLASQYSSCDKLPLKRQALSKSVRDTYSNIVKSKEVGEIDLLQLFPKSQSQKFIQNKKELSAKRPKNEVSDVDDESYLISKIGDTAFESFKNKLSLYNKYYTNYLVEPSQKFSSFKDLRIRFKPNVVSEHKILTSRPDSKNKNLRGRSAYLSSVENSDPIFNQYILQKLGSKNKLLQLKFDQHYTEILDTIENSQAKIENQEKEIKSVNCDRIKMQIMGESLDTTTALSKDELEFLKLVKSGSDSDIVAKLFQNPDYVHIRDLMKETPLHWAAKRGYANIVKILVKYGADVMALDLANRKPKDLALVNRHEDVLSVLLNEEKHVKHLSSSINESKSCINSSPTQSVYHILRKL